jgi:CRISPR type III-B/RAMP module-associated protein Cmr3
MIQALLIRPRDLLFCRDGRPIVAGEGAAAGSQLPGPQVLAGALRTVLLKARRQLHDGPVAQADLNRILRLEVGGPLLWDAQAMTPFIPMPADLIGEKPKHGRLGRPEGRLAPREGVPGWTAPEDAARALPLWPLDPRRRDIGQDKHRPGEQAPQTGFLTWKGFQTWAEGRVPQQDELRAAARLWAEETRTQVALDAAEATAAEGLLFSTRYLRLQKDVALYEELEGDQAGLPQEGTLHLGGDRRLADWKSCPRVRWPDIEGEAVALALTPVILPADEGRCPVIWKDACRGLAILGADPVSGWDLSANGGKGAPRPVRWAIRPGSVWHLATGADHPKAIGLETESGFGRLAYGKAPIRP